MEEGESQMEEEESSSDAHHHQPDVPHHHGQTKAPDHQNKPEVRGHHQAEVHHQAEEQHQPDEQHQSEDHQAHGHHSEEDTTTQEVQPHQAIMALVNQEPSQDAPRVAVQPLPDQPNQQQQNTPQQIVIHPQTMIIPPAQGSPPRVSVHYLASNTTSQGRATYQPALQQNVPSVTQSDTALLHEVLNELATRSLFNS